jgi:hypothetical protein
MYLPLLISLNTIITSQKILRQRHLEEARDISVRSFDPELY